MACMPEMKFIDRPECGALFQGDSVRWQVWAPKAERVDLELLEANKWASYTIRQEERGYFSFEKEQLRSGQRYAYRLNGGPVRPDPASRWQPDGVSRPSAVLCLDDFRWTDAGWRGIPREDLVFMNCMSARSRRKARSTRSSLGCRHCANWV